MQVDVLAEVGINRGECKKILQFFLGQFTNIFSGVKMTSLPLEVLLEIVKWLSLEECSMHLAPVCRYFYAAMHDSSLW